MYTRVRSGCITKYLSKEYQESKHLLGNLEMFRRLQNATPAEAKENLREIEMYRKINLTSNNLRKQMSLEASDGAHVGAEAGNEIGLGAGLLAGAALVLRNLPDCHCDKKIDPSEDESFLSFISNVPIFWGTLFATKLLCKATGSAVGYVAGGAHALFSRCRQRDHKLTSSYPLMKLNDEQLVLLAALEDQARYAVEHNKEPEREVEFRGFLSILNRN